MHPQTPAEAVRTVAAIPRRASVDAPPAATTGGLTFIRWLDPAAFLRHLWQHRTLIAQFTRREVEGRYRGSFLGLSWSIINPLVLLLIYTFVFGVVFRLRWEQAGSDRLRFFALAVFCSLTAFNLFGEAVSRASGVIVAVPNFVKKVVFPLEILPVIVIGSAVFHGLMSLLLLLIANLLVNHSLHWTVLFVPLSALPLLCLALGFAWFLASLGVFVRDIHHVAMLFVQVLLFCTPVFYPIESLPANLKDLMLLNPLVYSVEDFRRTILWGLPPHWSSLAWRLPFSVLVMMLGYAWFMKTKRGFADVL